MNSQNMAVECLFHPIICHLQEQISIRSRAQLQRNLYIQEQISIRSRQQLQMELFNLIQNALSSGISASAILAVMQDADTDQHPMQRDTGSIPSTYLEIPPLASHNFSKIGGIADLPIQPSIYQRFASPQDVVTSEIPSSAYFQRNSVSQYKNSTHLNYSLNTSSYMPAHQAQNIQDDDDQSVAFNSFQQMGFGSNTSNTSLQSNNIDNLQQQVQHPDVFAQNIQSLENDFNRLPEIGFGNNASNSSLESNNIYNLQQQVQQIQHFDLFAQNIQPLENDDEEGLAFNCLPEIGFDNNANNSSLESNNIDNFQQQVQHSDVVASYQMSHDLSLPEQFTNAIFEEIKGESSSGTSPSQSIRNIGDFNVFKKELDTLFSKK